MVALATVADLTTAMQQGALDEPAAAQAIASASAWVESQCRMAFTERTATVRLPASAAVDIRFPLQPLRSVASVTLDGVAVADYHVTVTGSLYRAGSWRTAYTPQILEVTATYGTAVVPDDIKAVVLEVAAGIYGSTGGVRSEGVDDHRVTYTGELSECSRQTLAGYGAAVAAVPMAGR